MRVAFISRSTLFTIPGGDTVQMEQTARELRGLGVDVEILLSNSWIDYEKFDLLHFFNIIRPADILYHYRKAKKPLVISTILCNYEEYDKHHRKGVGILFKFLPGDSIEYLKTIARWVLGRDQLASPVYAWKGQRNSIVEILKNAKMILPNSESEYGRLRSNYPAAPRYNVIPNGIDPELFSPAGAALREPDLVICAARIEGIKNQLNLIKALNNTRFRLLIIGAHTTSQQNYYRECQSIAAPNVSFIGHLPQEALTAYYRRAKVHVLPSWFETTGLSSIEAAAMGCSIVITDKGDTKEYFGEDAFYCDPADPESIRRAVEKAANTTVPENLRQKILEQYTWQRAAQQTLKAYQSVLNQAS